LFEATGSSWIAGCRNDSTGSLTHHASRRPPTTAKVMSKIATSDTIRVIVGQKFSVKENTTGDKNGANPETSAQPAKGDDAISQPPWCRHGESSQGIRRAEARSPQPQPAEK
jgi:hypothetical protein